MLVRQRANPNLGKKQFIKVVMTWNVVVTDKWFINYCRVEYLENNCYKLINGSSKIVTHGSKYDKYNYFIFYDYIIFYC